MNIYFSIVFFGVISGLAAVVTSAACLAVAVFIYDCATDSDVLEDRALSIPKPLFLVAAALFIGFFVAGADHMNQQLHSINYQLAAQSVTYARQSPEHARAITQELAQRGISTLDEALNYRMVGVIEQADVRVRNMLAERIDEFPNVDKASRDSSIAGFHELVQR